jgi:hypothetical protein
MNHCNLQQSAFAVVGSEEMRGSVSISDLKGPMVCPKPRRVGVLANNSLRPLRWHMRYKQKFVIHSLAFYADDMYDRLLRIVDLWVSFVFVFLVHSHQAEVCDSKAGADLLDMILMRVSLYFSCLILFEVRSL